MVRPWRAPHSRGLGKPGCRSHQQLRQMRTTETRAHSGWHSARKPPRLNNNRKSRHSHSFTTVDYSAAVAFVRVHMCVCAGVVDSWRACSYSHYIRRCRVCSTLWVRVCTCSSRSSGPGHLHPASPCMPCLANARPSCSAFRHCSGGRPIRLSDSECTYSGQLSPAALYATLQLYSRLARALPARRRLEAPPSPLYRTCSRSSAH